VSPFHGDRQNPPILLSTADVVTEQMLDEAVDGGEPTVARGRCVAAVALQMLQEGQDGLMADILELQPRRRTAEVVGKEQEVQPKSITVSTHSVLADAVDETEMVAEITLD
jgi:hypothetical protein